eukprot:145303_1
MKTQFLSFMVLCYYYQIHVSNGQLFTSMINNNTNDTCSDEIYCSGHGTCTYTNNETQSCECHEGWTTYPNINKQDDDPTYCNYQQKEQLIAFLLSVFLGVVAAGRFYCGQWVTAAIKMGFGGTLIGLCLMSCAFGCDELCNFCAWSCSKMKEDEGGHKHIYYIVAILTSIVWIITDWFLFGLNEIPDQNGVALKPW